MKKIVLLGSTGFIGRNTLKVIKNFINKFKVVSLAAKSNIDLLEIQANEFKPKIIAVYDEEKAKELKKRLNIKVVSGLEGLREAALVEADFIMAAMSGNVGIIPIIDAIKKGKTVGLANKEILVSAGELVTSLSKKFKATIIPVDSEHNAIFQCINGENIKDVKKIILTSSGGPFWRFTKKEMDKITPAMALKHPTYSMGKKISVDSSTLMNKGLEVIEAFFLFNVENIEVTLHPQSIIHSFVEFKDHSIKAEMGYPDMTLPIQYALNYPKREKGLVRSFDFRKNVYLEFYPVDLNKFKALSLAYEALKIKKSMLCYLNSANEVLVDRFLKKEISWLDISYKLEKLLSFHQVEDVIDLEAILEIDKKARKEAEKI
ncbi:MAG: 1-deoxy-D-xylulose 5-phosphate reductoisomerase [Chlamydiae bacterium SM23_39]|nr:MAG: 1-deoxy-D-xylulose 5-phosphate reductoisomerase [Chlamydiae bacterium SM23_39]